MIFELIGDRCPKWNPEYRSLRQLRHPRSVAAGDGPAAAEFQVTHLSHSAIFAERLFQNHVRKVLCSRKNSGHLTVSGGDAWPSIYSECVARLFCDGKFFGTEFPCFCFPRPSLIQINKYLRVLRGHNLYSPRSSRLMQFSSSERGIYHPVHTI